LPFIKSSRLKKPLYQSINIANYPRKTAISELPMKKSVLYRQYIFVPNSKIKKDFDENEMVKNQAINPMLMVRR